MEKSVTVQCLIHAWTDTYWINTNGGWVRKKKCHKYLYLKHETWKQGQNCLITESKSPSFNTTKSHTNHILKPLVIKL